MPISDLLGLMSLQVGSLIKYGLWSLSVIKESRQEDSSIRSSRSSSSAISLSLFSIFVPAIIDGFKRKSFNRTNSAISEQAINLVRADK